MPGDEEHSAPADAEEHENKEASSEVRTSGVPTWLVVTAALALTVVAIVIVYGYLARPKPEWVGVANKNVWDWLDLLVVPAALAVGVYWLNTRQAARQQQAENRRQASEEAAQEAQAQQALASEYQRAQDAALQAYLTQMSQLITDKEQPLHRARPGDSLSTLARARTLTVLESASGARKGMILDFLYTSGLITKKNPIVSLNRAFLADVGYLGANLKGSNLAGANLIQANLGVAVMDTAHDPQIPYQVFREVATNLVEANLEEAILGRANLKGADLTGANLTGANLAGANLTKARVTEEQLSQASSLEHATMPNGQKYEDWLKDKEDGKETGKDE